MVVMCIHFHSTDVTALASCRETAASRPADGQEGSWLLHMLLCSWMLLSSVILFPRHGNEWTLSGHSEVDLMFESAI